jgi:hypothetical protein
MTESTARYKVNDKVHLLVDAGWYKHLADRKYMPAKIIAVTITEDSVQYTLQLDETDVVVQALESEIEKV